MFVRNDPAVVYLNSRVIAAFADAVEFFQGRQCNYPDRLLAAASIGDHCGRSGLGFFQNRWPAATATGPWQAAG